MSSQTQRFPFRAMGGPCELHLEPQRGVDLDRVALGAIDEVLRIERKYSRYRDDSVIAEINRSAGSGSALEMDRETAGLLDYAALTYEQSGGLFDATSGVLRRAWDFKQQRLPLQSELDALLERVGWSQIRWNKPWLTLTRAGMELDFGGFGKEYAADRAASRCRELGLRAGLIDLGGDIAVIGPARDGGPYWIGVRNPRSPDRAIARVPLRSGGIATSGDYERFMIVGGRRHSHLLDPRSGWSVRGGFASASVIASRCLVAGSAATIAMLFGVKRGAAFLDELGLPNLRVDAAGRVSGTLARVGRALAQAG